MAEQQQQPAAAGAEMLWPTNPTSYQFLGKIGQGAFATVWRANAMSSSSTTGGVSTSSCAVKVLNLDRLDQDLNEIRKEVQAMRLSLHPNVLQCYTAFVQEKNLWLVTQLCNKGSSLHCLNTVRRQQPTIRMEEHIMYILHETLLGLHYIHQAMNLIHRDIKAGNILLNGDGQVKIADFGVSGWLGQGGSGAQKAQTFIGTPCWMAPEVMEQIHGYDFRADIWSLGITALELAKGYAPYAKYPPMKVLIMTIQEDPPSLLTYEMQDEQIDDDLDDEDRIVPSDESYSKGFASLVDTCLSKNPARRPACEELLQSKYFAKYSAPGGEVSENRLREREQVRQLLSDSVPDVGIEDQAIAQQTTEQQQQSSSDKTVGRSNSVVSILFSAASNERPAGTTWVFEDGSQVLASSVGGEAQQGQQQPQSVDDVMRQLDDFGKETGGENYVRQQQETEALTNQRIEPPPSAVSDPSQDAQDDDLDKFMDEFEQNTAGENFQHPSYR